MEKMPDMDTVSELKNKFEEFSNILKQKLNKLRELVVMAAKNDGGNDQLIWQINILMADLWQCNNDIEHLYQQEFKSIIELIQLITQSQYLSKVLVKEKENNGH